MVELCIYIAVDMWCCICVDLYSVGLWVCGVVEVSICIFV